MTACDYCDMGLIIFCHMSETTEGMEKFTELVEAWELNGFFPCDHSSSGYHQEFQRKWLDDKLRYLFRNREATDNPRPFGMVGARGAALDAPVGAVSEDQTRAPGCDK